MESRWAVDGWEALERVSGGVGVGAPYPCMLAGGDYCSLFVSFVVVLCKESVNKKLWVYNVLLDDLSYTFSGRARAVKGVD